MNIDKLSEAEVAQNEIAKEHDDKDMEMPESVVVNLTDQFYNYFTDGTTKIEKRGSVLEQLTPSSSEFESDEIRIIRKQKDKRLAWKDPFLKNLANIGLLMETEIREGDKSTIHFIKLNIPWNLMVKYAQDLNFRAPIQAVDNNEKLETVTDKLFRFIHMRNALKSEAPPIRYDLYHCLFQSSKQDKFLGNDRFPVHFSNTQRSLIVHEILQTTPFGRTEKGEIGIDRLIRERVFQAAYPLHEGDYKFSPTETRTPQEENNPRRILYDTWARYRIWYKSQPLDLIREYFGEKISMYFAWLGLYTAWLLPASIVGILVFLFGFIYVSNNVPVHDICTLGQNITMCPICDELSLKDRPRPEFAVRAPSVEKNPVTGLLEPYFPTHRRRYRILAGVLTLSVMICIVLIFIIAVIVYRIIISIPLFKNKELGKYALSYASITGAVLNLVIIMILGRLYEILARKLTQWEMHRTQTEFDNYFTIKVFLFQFINFYSSIFYVAFFKGKFTGQPSNYWRIFGLRQEECGQGGCLIELAQQLAIIMIGKQAINNIQEIVVPKLQTIYHKLKVSITKSQTRWEDDYKRIEFPGLFEEYLEMVLQFGFITIFVAAFPLAPLFALLNNWIEIRLDAHKLVCET
ncbi:unnamed protein product, partial [Didymodactylos carnosus]